MSLWLSEWNKFSPEAIKRMKTHSDKTHDEREWMCYVYDVDGTYELGEVSYGSESRIEVSPSKKAAQDRIVNGYKEKDRKCVERSKGHLWCCSSVFDRHYDRAS